ENLRLALLLESALVKYRWNKPPYWHLWDRIKSPFGVAVHSFMPGSHQNGISFMRPGIWPAIAIFEPLWQALFNARRLRKPSRLAITSLVHFIVRHELDHSRMWRLPRRVPFSWQHDLQDEIARIKNDLRGLDDLLYLGNREAAEEVERLLGFGELEAYRNYIFDI